MSLQSIDLDVLYFFNRTISALWLDIAMSFLTNIRNWVPVYILAATFLIGRYRLLGVRMVVACAILIGFANLLTNSVLKEVVARPRPCSMITDPSSLYSWIRTPDGARFGYSFPSSHAVNNIAGVVFFIFLFPKNRKLLWLLVPATVVAVTRLYLGLHYPTDVLGGMAIGALLGYSFSALYQTVERRFFEHTTEIR